MHVRAEGLFVLALIIAAILLTCDGCTPPILVRTEPRGAAAMTSLDRLPYFKTGTSIHQVSSFDRSGGNADGSHFYMYEHPMTGGFVVLDETRPGTIYRIWATGSSGVGDGNIRIYFDGEETPRVDVPLNMFFSGSLSPFLFPLVGSDVVSSGGNYSYYPFSFEQAVRVEFTVVPQYYQITYHLYDTDDGVTTYTGEENLVEVYDIWNNPSVDPKDTTGNKHVSVGPFDLSPGHTETLLDIGGSGAIKSFVLTFPYGVTADILSNVCIQMYWDGEITPSVDVPLGYLFGIGSGGEGLVEGLLMGADPQTHTFYNYFPMPYSQRAAILLVNDSETPIEGATAVLQVNNKPYEGLGTNAGYFTTTHREEKPTTHGRDYHLMDTIGRGHVVSTVLDISQFDDNSVLEGDERIFIDAVQQIQGTGMEDYFNGGWYFNRGIFTLPVHGAPLFHGLEGTKHVVAYRLSLADAMPFEESIVFSMEHGGQNDKNAHFESVVFAYVGG